ncbi:reverse transcriptase domain-containing protein [Tanacetum coccineum]
MILEQVAEGQSEALASATYIFPVKQLVVGNQNQFATYTSERQEAQTWWNSHVKVVGAYIRFTLRTTDPEDVHSTPNTDVEYASTPTLSSPLPSPLSPLSSLLPRIPSPPLPIPSPPLPLPSPPNTSPTYVEALLGYRVGESSAAAAARQPVLDVTTVESTPGHIMSREVGYGVEDVWDGMVRDIEEEALKLLRIQTRDTRIGSLETLVVTLVAQTSSLQTQLTITIGRIQTLEAREPSHTDDIEDKMPPKKRTVITTTTTPTTDAQLKALISQGVADGLAKIKANRTSRNGDDSHDSRTGSRRTERAARKCNYSDFLKCQSLNFKGIEGVVGLTQWFERMESIFHISNCAVGNHIKFATCTLLGSALSWWNSHVKVVGHNTAYGMTWKSLMKMLTKKYCPRGEIKKLKIKIWNLKVKGTDVESYT